MMFYNPSGHVILKRVNLRRAVSNETHSIF
jgi:hypothetical protein